MTTKISHKVKNLCPFKWNWKWCTCQLFLLASFISLLYHLYQCNGSLIQQCIISTKILSFHGNQTAYQLCPICVILLWVPLSSGHWSHHHFYHLYHYHQSFDSTNVSRHALGGTLKNNCSHASKCPRLKPLEHCYKLGIMIQKWMQHETLVAWFKEWMKEYVTE